MISESGLVWRIEKYMRKRKVNWKKKLNKKIKSKDKD